MLDRIETKYFRHANRDIVDGAKLIYETIVANRGKGVAGQVLKCFDYVFRKDLDNLSEKFSGSLKVNAMSIRKVLREITNEGLREIVKSVVFEVLKERSVRYYGEDVSDLETLYDFPSIKRKLGLYNFSYQNPFIYTLDGVSYLGYMVQNNQLPSEFQGYGSAGFQDGQILMLSQAIPEKYREYALYHEVKSRELEENRDEKFMVNAEKATICTYRQDHPGQDISDFFTHRQNFFAGPVAYYKKKIGKLRFIITKLVYIQSFMRDYNLTQESVLNRLKDAMGKEKVNKEIFRLRENLFEDDKETEEKKFWDRYARNTFINQHFDGGSLEKDLEINIANYQATLDVDKLHLEQCQETLNMLKQFEKNNEEKQL